MEEKKIMDEEILKVRNINKKYKKKKGPDLKVLKDLNLTVYKHEILGLVGESGCGKSTLAKIIMGLEKPDKGEIYFHEQEITGLSDKKTRQLKKDIQYIFQDPKATLNHRKTIGWLLEEPLKVHTNLSKEDREKQVKEMLDLVGLSHDYLNRYPHSLSGGQAQRIAILTALMNQPQLLIADEAVSALDVSIQAQILNFLQYLKKEMDLTMIFITHDLSVCHFMSDRIAVMYSGRIVEIGYADDIYYNPKHPYTQELFQSILTINSKETDFKIKESEKIELGNKYCDFADRCPYRMEKCTQELPKAYKLKDKSNVRCFLYEDK